MAIDTSIGAESLGRISAGDPYVDSMVNLVDLHPDMAYDMFVALGESVSPRHRLAAAMIINDVIQEHGLDDKVVEIIGELERDEEEDPSIATGAQMWSDYYQIGAEATSKISQPYVKQRRILV